jgi:hypothetical protein
VDEGVVEGEFLDFGGDFGVEVQMNEYIGGFEGAAVADFEDGFSEVKMADANFVEEAFDEPVAAEADEFGVGVEAGFDAFGKVVAVLADDFFGGG